MTLYQGGKGRIGHQLHAVMRKCEQEILGDDRDELLPYFEPFVGMAGVLRHFGPEYKQRPVICASDKSPDIVVMWKEVQRGWVPPTACSKQQFNAYKTIDTEPSADRTFLGHAASYGGNFLYGYRLDYHSERDYLGEAARSIERIRPNIQNVHFLPAASYTDFRPKGMLVYCDPPYQNNKLTGSMLRKFDHDMFWKTMEDWSRDNLVFISERTAPDSFVPVFVVNSHVANHRLAKTYSEALFVSRRWSPYLTILEGLDRWNSGEVVSHAGPTSRQALATQQQEQQQQQQQQQRRQKQRRQKQKTQDLDDESES